MRGFLPVEFTMTVQSDHSMILKYSKCQRSTRSLKTWENIGDELFMCMMQLVKKNNIQKGDCDNKLAKCWAMINLTALLQDSGNP